MDKFFITMAGCCAIILSILCAYRYFTYVHASYVELICSVMFIIVAGMSFYARRWCK